MTACKTIPLAELSTRGEYFSFSFSGLTLDSPQFRPCLFLQGESDGCFVNSRKLHGLVTGGKQMSVRCKITKAGELEGGRNAKPLPRQSALALTDVDDWMTLPKNRPCHMDDVWSKTTPLFPHCQTHIRRLYYCRIRRF
jgi:hypothetical protein